MNKPKLSVTITSLYDNTITKTYTKANGLTSLTINGVSNNVPSYGIIAHSGSVEIIDSEGWLKEQSDANVLPDVSVIVRINGAIIYSFKNDNDINYSIHDKKVKINLSDSILSLQEYTFDTDLLYANTNAYLCAIDLFSKLGLYVTIGLEEQSKLSKILFVDTVLIKADTYWNILEEFLVGINAIMYALGDSYYIKMIKE